MKYSSLLLSAVLVAPSISAQDNLATNTAHEAGGFTGGAIIGGLIGGPVGAVIGAASGAIYGNHEAKEAKTLVQLEQEQLNKQIELAQLKQEVTQLQSEHLNRLRNVALNQKNNNLKQLKDSINLSVFYRTNTYDVNQATQAKLQHLVTLIKDHPEINVSISAHTDARGSHDSNKQLSIARASRVAETLLNAGLPSSRIIKQAYGEHKTQANHGDVEAYFFDRRVDIELTFDQEA